MGCCLGALLLAGAPRLALLVWWFADPNRILNTFATWSARVGTPGVPEWVWPLAGFVLLPWTTIAYIFVAPGGVTGLEWVILVIGLLFDFGAHGGGGRAYSRRRAMA